MVYTPAMADPAVMLKVEGRRCVVIGGGKTALRRARMLLESGAEVYVVGREMDEAFKTLGVPITRRDYQPGDVQGAYLVVVATDDPAVNQRVTEDAREVGALVNRVDDPADSDLLIPAQARCGPVTLAVHTSGISAKAAADIRDELLDHLDPDWPRLLETAQPYRGKVQAHYADRQQRRAALVRLTDSRAMRILKNEGEAALRAHFDQLV